MAKEKGLVLKMVCEPSLRLKSTYYTPLCSDNKVHIRFRDYVGAETIAGLEAKLTYLLTYVFNKEFVYTEVSRDDDRISSGNFEYLWNKYITRFLTTKSYLEIRDLLREHFGVDDILFMPKYTKSRYSNPWEQFGSLLPGTCILISSEDRLNGSGSLDAFLSALGISLEKFLLDDAYYLTLGEKAGPQNINSKFIKKNIKKKHLKKKKIVTVVLW